MKRRRLSLSVVLPVALALFVSACAAPGAVEREPEPADELPVPVPGRLADYEDFDVEAYREARPEEEAIEHDVPEVLMENRAAASNERVAQGFRIQVISSVEKDAAVAAEVEARRWWRNEGSSAYRGAFPSELPTYVVYQQPYYRLRIGDFATRQDAQQALAAIEGRYPGAFIVPDTVTLRD